MGDFVSKVDIYLKEKGWNGRLELAFWTPQPSLICWGYWGSPSTGQSDNIYDTEDFEEQVYEIVKKYVKL